MNYRVVKAESSLYLGYHVSGPYFYKSTGRWHVDIRKGYDRIGMYYSRYIMQEFLGRILKSYEEVDHIDEDKTNDVLSNLQVLTKAEHNDKTRRIYAKSIQMVCQYCGEEFAMSDARQRAWKTKQRLGADGPFCNKSHAAKFRSQNRSGDACVLPTAENRPVG